MENGRVAHLCERDDVGVIVCGRDGVWAWWCVDVAVCGRDVVWAWRCGCDSVWA